MLSLFGATDFSQLFDPSNPALAMIVAIVASATVVTIITVTKMRIRHRERMAMIEHGMHPDYEVEETPPD